ncbi:MAG TPA: class I SAM-dependent methyltransferase [Planctomycetota bacterium]|nr:class I SAM-dependent methyltransferase [Planctomycetota bacterium]
MREASWETLYRWDWFHRDAWRRTFRDWKRGKFGGSSACFAEIVRELGGGPTLDCSCGLGLKTIVMKEMGVDIIGSDRCAFAVEKARELAASEGLDIKYFTSSWAALPKRTPQRFAGIFNDALTWTLTREEFEASLRGLHEALDPGGVLVFFGAEEGGRDDPDFQRELLLESCGREPKFRIEWTHEAEGTRCTSIAVRELGDTFFDEHHLYLIEEAGKQRLETATIRQPVLWHWPLLVELFESAGFSKLETRTFAGRARDGGTVKLNVATK